MKNENPIKTSDIAENDRLTVEVPTEIKAGASLVAAAYGCTVYSCSSLAAVQLVGFEAMIFG